MLTVFVFVCPSLDVLCVDDDRPVYTGRRGRVAVGTDRIARDVRRGLGDPLRSSAMQVQMGQQQKNGRVHPLELPDRTQELERHGSSAGHVAQHGGRTRQGRVQVRESDQLAKTVRSQLSHRTGRQGRVSGSSAHHRAGSVRQQNPLAPLDHVSRSVSVAYN